MSRFLTIDPGSVKIGLAVFNEQEILYSFSFIIEGKTLTEKLGFCYEIIQKVIQLYRPNLLVYEEQVFLKSAAFLSAGIDAIKVVGVLCLMGYLNGVKIVSFKPSEIKTVVTGKENSSKKIVEANVQLFANKKTFSSKHEVDAIAIGMCYLETLKKDGTENK